MTVHHSDIIIASLSELYAGYILEPQYCTVAFGTDYHVLVILYFLIASPVFENVSEGVVGFRSKGSGRGLDILFSEHSPDIRRHEVVLCHLSRIHPYTE